jgi:multisubunit Na+/H+ antiporter MnhE subunit
VALRATFGFWPIPTFEFRDWLTGLILAVIILLALSPLVFGGSRRILPFFHFFAIVMVLNGRGH